MQRLHEEDLAGWLLDGGNGEEWEHLELSAIQPDGSALWPEKHSIETLERMELAAPYVLPANIVRDPHHQLVVLSLTILKLWMHYLRISLIRYVLGI